MFGNGRRFIILNSTPEKFYSVGGVQIFYFEDQCMQIKTGGAHSKAQFCLRPHKYSNDAALSHIWGPGEKETASHNAGEIG